MFTAIAFVFVVWLLAELILYVVHCYRHRHLTSAPKRQEDRILISSLGMAFGMFVAVMAYLYFTFYSVPHH